MEKIDFKKMGGLVPVVVQDHETGEVLMLAFMNQEAWEWTRSTGMAHYWSRSRGRLWKKGETSGHVQIVKEVLLDCDEDSLLLKVEQVGGAACHTGYNSCFYRAVRGDKIEVIKDSKAFDPKDVYEGG